MSGLSVEGLVVERGGFVLGPVDLSVGSGTATALLGPSGAGKTTLLRALAGFLPLRAGRITRDWRRVDGEPPERRRFGFVPPNLGLFPDRTVLANVGYPLRLAGRPDAADRTRYWLGRFGLPALAHRYPAQLSSGERQRVAMARALAAEPAALLWDEPLAALDLESRDALLEMLREVLETSRVPLVLVTHDPATAAALASTYVVLAQGRVRFRGGPQTLADAPLDRFTARFLGYDNLYSRAELEASRTTVLGQRLLTASGTAGVVVLPRGLRWRPNPVANAVVTSLRATPAGWVVALRSGSLTFRTRLDGPVPTVRLGDAVEVDVDDRDLRPLDDPSEAG